MAMVFHLAGLITGACQAAPATVAEWSFMRPGDLLGWQPNGHLAGIAVTNGALSGRTAGSDPILEYRPLLDIQATPWQVVEIRLRADSDGTAELFWSSTSTGRFGGFTQEKTTRFNVRGDGQWHVYRLLPFWHREDRIVRLRFDLYDGTKFDLASIRIVNLVSAPPATQAEFNFDKNGWQWLEFLGDAAVSPTAAPGRLTRCGEGLLLGPPVQIDTSENTFVSVTMSVDRGHHGTLFFATDASSGLHKRTFPLKADGHKYTYNLDMLQATEWKGNVVALGLQPSNDTNAVASLSRLKAGSEPEGPPHLRVMTFSVEEALPRVGLPATASAILSNDGAGVMTNIVVEIELPVGLKLAANVPAKQVIARLGFDEEKVVTWKVQAIEPGLSELQLKASAASAEPVLAKMQVRFTPRHPVPTTAYVPEPKPVRGPYEVGVYYFPGWKTASQWEPLKRFPERKPVLGYYREGEPEIADWHIKWAVEHGIAFFAYDWYWSKGARHLEHALHDGYFKARYRYLMKFCLLWANHNPPGSSSHEDCLAVTRYWIENYFRRPEHLLFDGKPVMIIFSPDRFTQDLGIEGTRRAFQAMRAECEAAGLKGLYLIACVGDAGGARRAAEEGYDSVTAYNWPGLGLTGETLFGPFESLLEGYRRQWNHILDQGQLPLAPVPVCGGWDSRPWHGENNLVRYGRTPELFKRHLLDARRLLESAEFKPGTPRAILVEAWNEWGEGSYIEPHAEFGFGYLDSLRETFTSAPTAHVDLTPADANLGPYDVVPSEPEQTAWDFSKGDNAWENSMQLDGLKVAQGVLSARSVGNDPAFFGPGIRAAASDFGAVEVRMRVKRVNGQTGRDSAQLFWRTSRLAESESSSARFSVELDGEWHTYRIPVGQNPRWRGVITRLRLDPVNQPDVEVEISRIALGK